MSKNWAKVCVSLIRNYSELFGSGQNISCSSSVAYTDYQHLHLPAHLWPHHAEHLARTTERVVPPHQRSTVATSNRASRGLRGRSLRSRIRGQDSRNQKPAP